jgi:hypothetical protein
VVANLRPVEEDQPTSNPGASTVPVGRSGPEFGKRAAWWWGWLRPDYAQQPIFDTAEVAALVKFASEQGVDEPGDKLIMQLYRNLRVYDADPRSPAGQKSAEEILADYTALTRLTQNVNGRNLLSGRNLIWETKGFMFTTLIMFLASICALALSEWVSNNPLADEPLVGDFGFHYIQFFTPFLWGALGACVYILKRIGDEAASNRFDRDRFRGWGNKALLGAVLGGSITYIVDPDAFSSVSLSITAVAFLTGLGTKIVYGALEKLIALLADKMNLDTVREGRTSKSAVSEFLTGEIARTDPKAQSARYKMLVELLDAHASTSRAKPERS